MRTALFVCAVCSHGGHRDCYYRFYMQRPMVELSVSTLPLPSEERGRRSIRSSGVSPREQEGSYFSKIDENAVEERKGSMVRVMGHPCAAGCGHHCWASSEKMTSI